MTINVGGREFEFRKPVMKHLKHLASKQYEEWFQSNEMVEALQSEEKFQAYSEKWKSFCADVFVTYGEEMDFERLTPSDVEDIVRGFFASLRGTPNPPA